MGGVHINRLEFGINGQCKEEGKDQDSIQPSSTPDPGHYMGK